MFEIGQITNVNNRFCAHINMTVPMLSMVINYSYASFRSRLSANKRKDSIDSLVKMFVLG